ncbi:nuclear transport factor 2 family protein [uncultured Pseudokineococcus sp.]|uniref:nuclear transport factor 2 family protein n=1 Tax=uncultured Pseudokineococcus sp. TaxID=1642928 RepID=UPI00261D2D74|nr:nuclear transport factor 2 family protein [uncultured Pseudokineococcus sp.]
MDARELDEVVALERELLEPVVRGCRQRLEALLDEDFTEVGASGRSWTRASVVEALLAERAAGPAPLDDVRAVALGEEVVLVTYLSDRPTRPVRRSSVWHRRDRAWRLRHHQGTPLPPPPDRGGAA